jgi:hypothetical protein
MRCSCQNENNPLITMTPTTAYPICAIPWPGSNHSAVKASAAATHRITENSWTNSLAKCSSGCRREIFSIRLGPHSARRRLASADDSPSLVLPTLSSASSTES